MSFGRRSIEDPLPSSGDARLPPAWNAHMGNGVIPDSFIPEPPNGHVEFGAVSDQFLIAAYDGTGAYAKDGPRRQLRLIANIASPVYLIVAARRGAGITDLAQLKDHKGPLKIVAIGVKLLTGSYGTLALMIGCTMRS